LFGDLFVKSGDRFRIGNVASKGVNFWKGRFRAVHLSLIAARDKNRVTKCRELFGELVTDATKQLTALGNTILITGRDQAKMDRAKAAFPKNSHLSKRRFRSEAIATLYEQVTKQFPELNILINNAGIMREINIHDKAGSLEDITREIEINLSGADSHGEAILAALKTKIRGRNHERFIGIGICSIAHFTGLLRHQGRSALVHRVSSCATAKYQSEGI